MYDDVCKAMAKQAVALEVRIIDNVLNYLVLGNNYAARINYFQRIIYLLRCNNK